MENWFLSKQFAIMQVCGWEKMVVVGVFIIKNDFYTQRTTLVITVYHSTVRWLQHRLTIDSRRTKVTQSIFNNLYRLILKILCA